MTETTSTSSTATAPEIPSGITQGPLTTAFEAPSSCDLGSTYLVEAKAIGYKYYQHGPLSSKDGCMPSGWALNAFYSPGVCPQSYTPACSGTERGLETTICCPENGIFTCADAIWYGRYGCASSFTPTVTIVHLTGVGDTTSTWGTSEVSASSIWAYSVQVRNDAPPTSTPEPTSSSSSGLSSGAVAGIVIGAVVAVAIPLVFGMIFFWRRARAGRQAETSKGQVQEQYAGGQWQNWRPPQELDQQPQLSELPLSQQAAELSSSGSQVYSSSSQGLKP